MDILQTDIKNILGLGPKWRTLFMEDMDISTFDDLLQLYPYKYVDRSRIFQICDITNEMPFIQICGRFVTMQTLGTGRQQRLSAMFTDGTGQIEVLWFQGLNYVQRQINYNDEFVLFGKPSVFGGRFSIVHPEMERADRAQISAGSLQPMYNTSERMKRAGLNTKSIQKLMNQLFNIQLQATVNETLSYRILNEYHLVNRSTALRIIHFPQNYKDLEKAVFRLKFEELFFVQLGILRNRNINRHKQAGIKFSEVGPLLTDFYKKHIPFEPTNAQKRVVREIWSDLQSGHQMNRLIQGDVGSGKTLVALMAMLIVVGNKLQACMMAPTEILATQHYEGLSSFVKDMPIRVELLTGSTKKKSLILKDLAEGKIDILVGTHALIEDTVIFAHLGMAIVDEQHRFGVQQRAKLWKKGIIPPHILVMTATPIPRTLAMTVYGDLDVSVIDELPPGRKPVRTEHYFHQKRNNLNAFLRQQLQLGRQIYVVYPLIEESESLDYKNLTEGFEYMKDAFKEYNVCMVHGKMKADEKEAAMQSFVSGQAHIMVATTVIEVGVNVPNASVMIIESAERFGLSQLHQLRGRVGRGADQSFCVLMTSEKLSNETRQRMQIMVDTTDGFRIAEADLQLRGPGNIEGTQQSGLPFSLHIADLAKDARLVQYTREAAEKILSEDPLLQAPDNQGMAQRLSILKASSINWSSIS
ncbi:MAG: ATP-dependent DNA helicase RecG [Bacteroidales bacterium]|nr:ATP-dependent DNA helicase RecG [Bacteroidales bacterium]